MKLLEGKTVIVTGAARGIGWGVARALGLAGARVCITDIDDVDMKRSLSDLKADGTDAIAVHHDTADLKGWQELVKQVVARWGRLDAVVQNAVYMPLIRFENTSEELFWRQLHISLGGFFNATRATWDLYKAQGGGHVIGIASGSSVRGYIDESTYCTGKHGQEGFVKSVSIEAKPYRISLNTIGPGARVKPTDVTWEMYDAASPEEKAKWTDPVHLGKAFVWLVSQDPGRYSGFRFDAGVVAKTIDAEGYNFEFSPEKVTLYVDDFKTRQDWYAVYPG